MTPSRMILLSPLIAVVAAGTVGVAAHAQQQTTRRPAPAARSAKANANAKGQAQPKPQPAPDPAKMDWLLKAWEGQSAKLKTLDVRIYRVDKDFRWRTEDHFEGRAVFKSPGLAYVDFSQLKLKKDEKGHPAPVPDPKNPKKFLSKRTETIVCGKDAVWQYLHQGRQIYVFPLAKGERQRALDEGPLPFLFNMKAASAKARYDMTLMKENADYYMVRVVPKLDEDKENFKVAWLYLEKKYLLPKRISLLSPDGKSSREYYLRDQMPNAKVQETIFKGGPIQGWVVQKNPAPDAPRQGNAGPRPGRAGGAMRR